MSRRHGFSLIELMVSTAILGGTLLVVYTLLTEGYRFAADLPGKETADNLSLSTLTRYHGLYEEDLIELVGMNQWVDPGKLGDETIDATDPRSPEELDRRGHHRRVRFRRLPGDYGGIGLEGVVTWRDAMGRLRQYGFGSYFVPPKQWHQGMEDLPGFRSADEEGWGHANGWRVEHPDQVDGPLADPRRGRRHGRKTLSELVHEVARARVEDRRARTPIRDRPEVVVRGEPAALDPLPFGKGRGTRSQQDRTQELRDQAAARRFRERNRLDGLDWKAERVPDGTYSYLLDTLDRRARPTEDRVIGVYNLVPVEGQGEHQLVAQSVWSPERSWRMGGDEVLERRLLQAADGRPWVLHRSVDRLYLLDRGQGLFGRRLEILTLPCVDGTPEGLPVNRRLIEARLAAHGLEPARVELPDELGLAADERRLVAEGWNPEVHRSRLTTSMASAD